ncbi:MAG: HlyD family efflux transporter periplasmic adaptor subunit [Pleurocapsa sp. SU_5_0]|nr:HlyD family efflux transporter periplasmic adaptor subunit [Pleurocapsa sp. SU_5_0]NJO96555.1 HlyD family efflux transporter periplasmic adaptor subunit [Pleurocapsa sp. CRU_1_2]NJR45718.1 HlyD family efflux transporter periplasmic adaptor subunit [Hyellaceae cyanobacterium CSU_1_1]
MDKLDKLPKLPLNNKLIIAFCLGGLALVMGTTIYSLNQANSKEETETIKPQPIKAVTALGRIEPQGQMIQVAPSPELGGAKITRLLVAEGDRVTAGQTIALLDNHRRAKAALEVARQEVKVAQADLAIIQAGAKQGDINAQVANLQQFKAELEGEIVANEAEVARLQAQLGTESLEKQATTERLQAELRNAASEFKRYQQLGQQGVISASELDSRRLTLDTAKTAVAEAQASYHRTRTTLQQQINQAQAIALQNKNTLQQQISGAEATLASVGEVREVDVIKAQAEVDKAIASLRQTEEDLELTNVKAPSDGQIIKINAYPGEQVGDEGIVEFAQTSKMMVVAEVYESDIGQVKVGQVANIASETGAFEGEITGKVSQIGLKIGKQDVLSTDPAADVDSRVVEVKIYLDEETSSRIASLTNSKAIVKINL